VSEVYRVLHHFVTRAKPETPAVGKVARKNCFIGKIAVYFSLSSLWLISKYIIDSNLCKNFLDEFLIPEDV
jgi:hypothetical protein